MEITLKTKPLKTIYKSLGLEEKGKVQMWLDKITVEYLQKYVSLDSSIQMKSIKTATTLGSGRVIINVPYARFQAGGKVMIGVKSHSAWAKKGERKVITGKDLTYHSEPLRGAHPFERMKADKGQSILNQTAKYARRFSDG